MVLGLWIVGFQVMGMIAGAVRITSIDSIPAIEAIWAIPAIILTSKSLRPLTAP